MFLICTCISLIASFQNIFVFKVSSSVCLGHRQKVSSFGDFLLVSVCLAKRHEATEKMLMKKKKNPYCYHWAVEVFWGRLQTVYWIKSKKQYLWFLCFFCPWQNNKKKKIFTFNWVGKTACLDGLHPPLAKARCGLVGWCCCCEWTKKKKVKYAI